MESLINLIENPPPALLLLVVLFLAALAILLFILPFIVISINNKMKRIARNMQSIHDEMVEVQDCMEKLRKEGTVANLMAREDSA